MSVLWTIFEYLWAAGLLVVFAAGLLALASPRLFVKANRVAATWVNIPAFNKLPDKTHNVDHVMYRFHIVVGALLVLGSLVMFYHLFFRIEAGTGLSLRQPFESVEVFWFGLTAEIVVTGVCLAAVVGLLAGLMMLVAPAFLKS